jgi:hypothetical protein
MSDTLTNQYGEPLNEHGNTPSQQESLDQLGKYYDAAAAAMDTNCITVVNTNSYGHNNDIHYRGTMQVEYILDLVPGAFHQPEDLVRWMVNHPYITSVTYTPKPEGPTKLEQLKKVFDDAYHLADQTGYDRYTNTKVSNYAALDKAHFAACHARDIAWTVYNDELLNG